MKTLPRNTDIKTKLETITSNIDWDNEKRLKVVKLKDKYIINTDGVYMPLTKLQVNELHDLLSEIKRSLPLPPTPPLQPSIRLIPEDIS